MFLRRALSNSAGDTDKDTREEETLQYKTMMLGFDLELDLKAILLAWCNALITVVYASDILKIGQYLLQW